MSDSVRPHRRQPTRLPRPWDSPGKNTGVDCHFLLQCMKVKLKVRLFNRVRLFATPWTEARQAPLSVGFPRQESWSGLPCPPSGGLPHPGTQPRSPALAGAFFTSDVHLETHCTEARERVDTPLDSGPWGADTGSGWGLHVSLWAPRHPRTHPTTHHY